MAVALTATGPTLQASEYHVDPDSVPAVYSGSALLLYYAEALDYVIQIQPENTREYVEALPFAEIPEDTRPETDEFSQSAVSLAFAVQEAYSLWDARTGLIGRNLLGEALALDRHIAAVIELTVHETDNLEQSLSNLGLLLDVASSEEGSDLRLAYQEVAQRIERLRDMLELLRTALGQSHSWDEEIQQRLIPVLLALRIEPESAFVGDTIHFEAAVYTAGGGLQGRELRILLNGMVGATVTTDASGTCSGEFIVPYWYVPGIEVRAYYQPLGADAGVNMGALSPAIDLNVLFFPVAVRIDLTTPAYPGMKATGTLHLDYGGNPPAENRLVAIYLDNQPVSQLQMGIEGTFSFALDSALRSGLHSVGVTVFPDARYAPAFISTALEVTKEITALHLDPQGMIWIPGSGEVSGTVTSALGPLAGASIVIDGSAKLKAVTDSRGRFTINVDYGMDMTLLGERRLALSVFPAEPWHTPISQQADVFTLNYVNCTLAALLTGFLGIYLPRRLTGYFHLSSRRGSLPVAVAGPPGAAIPVVSISSSSRSDTQVEPGTPRWVVYNLYRNALKLLVRLGVRLPGLHQTMREYAREASPLPDALRKHLFDFTVLVERYYYGPHPPMLNDAERSRTFMEQIELEANR